MQRPVEVPAGVTCLRVKDTRRALPWLSAAFHRHPGRRLPVVGITGTNGKTTITWMVESALAAAGRSVGVVGTTGHRVGGRPVQEHALLGGGGPHHTTPEAPLLQALLASMVAQGCAAALVEVSSIGLESFRADAVPYRVAVFTNLTRDHLDIHGSMEAYRSAKARLFKDLLAPDGRAILNRDDPAHRYMIPPSGEYWSYGLREGDLHLRQVEITADGSRAVVVTPGGSGVLELRLPGRHNLYNALASLGVALALQVPLEMALEGLGALRRVPGRVERVSSTLGFPVFVDYAHTPDALRAVLASMREAVSGRIITVFGCGGERDKGKRPQMGAVASSGSDRVVVTSDNPRGEEPDAIIRQILDGVDGAALVGNPPRVVVEPDREAAIRHAVEMARPGDAVLVAGKGHEATQDRGSEVIPFDDRRVARRALRARAERESGAGS